MKNTFPIATPPPALDPDLSQPAAAPTDAEKYRWIRDHRGNFEIYDALARADRDTDFDRRIEREMAISAAGRHSYVCSNPLLA